MGELNERLHLLTFSLENGGRMVQDNSQEKLKQLLASINRHRSNIISSAEKLVGDSPAWNSLRSRLLSACGDRGLERDVRQIMVKQLNHQMQSLVVSPGGAHGKK